jgi:indole-3-glycerol phosphate synthase
MLKTDTILDQIIADKKNRVEDTKTKLNLNHLRAQVEAGTKAEPHRFYDALKNSDIDCKLIAEIKRQSPSAGTFNEQFSLEQTNQAYQTAESVIAISVLTEEDHFKGTPTDLQYVHSHSKQDKPILRKDFIFDPYQVYESQLLGASAFLLIARLFDRSELQDLITLGKSIGLEPLIEVHSQVELDRVAATSARCIGVNSRDLQTFKIDHSLHSLLFQLDDRYARVAESGIEDPAYLRSLMPHIDAALIGGLFMKSDNISEAINTFVTDFHKEGNN